MKIAINALHLIPGRLGGLETYLHGLLADLPRNVDRRHHLRIYCSTTYADAFQQYAADYDVTPLDVNVASAAARVRFEQFDLPRRVRDDGVHLLHSSGYTAPATRCCKTVMTVHDINYLEIPHLIRRSHGLARWLVMRFLGPWSMRRTDHIITDTQHVARQLVRYAGIKPEKISTFYPRCTDYSQFQPVAVDLPREADQGFLLYIASWHPHKNHELLLQTYARARQQSVALPPLVLAGLHLRSRADEERVDAALGTHGVAEQVHLVKRHLAPEELAYLYRRAGLLVFPSLFEGFGLPVLEAMSAGVPVVCSAIEPLGEVTAGNAVTFDPRDSSQCLSTLVSVLQDPQRCAQLGQSGRRHFENLAATRFQTAEGLWRLYESL